ncbi:MAG: glycosyltransferase [Lachnospiraceae bacterium]|nr:glycosyltransferase [Lachnospiraceae bacterium]
MLDDIVHALKAQGHQVDVFTYRFEDKDYYENAEFYEQFSRKLKAGGYDRVISTNFFPLPAKLCHEQGILYVAWSYDSPLESGFEEYFAYDTNRIYLFDRKEAENYRKRGFTNVFHLPLAVNTARLDALRFSVSDQRKYSADISFVGNLYASSLDTLTVAASDYIKGYIECMVQTQIGLYGCYLLEQLATDEVVDALNASFRKIGQTKYRLNRRGLAFEVAKEVTNFERTTLLSVLGETHQVKFYSRDRGNVENVEHCGIVMYHNEMPGVFRYSKLNLNPTLRCIQSGIPLRALDIVGAGGVLLSNYQSELAEYFTDGESVILYGSLEEAVEKADYYLAHLDCLAVIAEKGREIAKKCFRFEDRIRMLTE